MPGVEKLPSSHNLWACADDDELTHSSHHNKTYKIERLTFDSISLANKLANSRVFHMDEKH
jgi:hypothetical protein